MIKCLIKAIWPNIEGVVDFSPCLKRIRISDAKIYFLSASHIIIASWRLCSLCYSSSLCYRYEVGLVLNYKQDRTSALDKLLGQLGIYATWLSSIAYLQKQLRIFTFFYALFFFCDNTFSYCVKPSGMCLHIYTRPLSAFLKYQNSRFYCT